MHAGQRAMVAVASALIAGCLNRNSPDFPGREDDYEPIVRGGAALWSVTDADTGEAIASGCNTRAFVAAVPGQRLIVELTTEHASVEQPGLATSEEFWCSDHPSIRKQIASAVDPLECWRVPQIAVEPPARVLEMEVIPPETERPIDRQLDLVPGRGYRFSLEVLAAGAVFLESSGACD